MAWQIKKQNQYPPKEPPEATHLLQFGLHPAGLEAEELGALIFGGVRGTGTGQTAQPSTGQHGEEIGVHFDLGKVWWLCGSKQGGRVSSSSRFDF